MGSTYTSKSAAKRVTKCPECYAPIDSRHAKTCAKCGAQLYYPRRSLFGVGILWLFFGFNAVMLYRVLRQGIEVFRTFTSISVADRIRHGAPTNDVTYELINLVGSWFIGAVCIGMLVLMTRPR